MNPIPLSALLAMTGLLSAGDAFAGQADVLDVKVRCSNERDCDFSVTVRHADVGWDHYANRWEVLGSNGELLASRTLLHPHVHEQPFTRSLDHVTIPDGVQRVIVRAHDLVHGYGREEVEVSLPFR